MHPAFVVVKDSKFDCFIGKRIKNNVRNYLESPTLSLSHLSFRGGSGFGAFLLADERDALAFEEQGSGSLAKRG